MLKFVYEIGSFKVGPLKFVTRARLLLLLLSTVLIRSFPFLSLSRDLMANIFQVYTYLRFGGRQYHTYLPSLYLNQEKEVFGWSIAVVMV